MEQSSPRFSKLGFSKSVDLVTTGLGDYLQVLKALFIPLILICALLHGADIILVLGHGAMDLLPSGLNFLLVGFLTLLSLTLGVYFPYFAIKVMLKDSASGDSSVSAILSEFSPREAWNILIIVSMTHIVGLMPLFVPAIVLWLHLIHEAFLWLALGIFLIYLPIWILILWFLGFSLHHYVFLQVISWQPLRASYLLVKNRFWCILLLSVGWLILSLALSTGFSLLKAMESGLRFLASSPQEGWMSSFQEISTILQSGKLNASTMKELGEKFSFLSAPSMIALIESMVTTLLSGSLFSFFFLYLLGHYHRKDWAYPRDLFTEK